MENEKVNKLGLALKDLRKENGLTAQQVADGIGLSRTTISKFENGLSGMCLGNFCAYLEFLGLEPMDMVKNRTHEVKLYKATQALKEIISQYE